VANILSVVPRQSSSKIDLVATILDASDLGGPGITELG